jgi:hypothetical protein
MLLKGPSEVPRRSRWLRGAKSRRRSRLMKTERLWSPIGRCQLARPITREIEVRLRKAPMACMRAGQRGLSVVCAEGVGFEPTETRNASPVFKTGAIGH